MSSSMTSSSPEAAITWHALEVRGDVWRVREEPASTCVVSSSAYSFTSTSGGAQSFEKAASRCLAEDGERRMWTSQEPVSTHRYVASTPEPLSDVEQRLLLSQSSYVSQLRPTRERSAEVSPGSDVMFTAASSQSTAPWYQEPRLPPATDTARPEASNYRPPTG